MTDDEWWWSWEGMRWAPDLPDLPVDAPAVAAPPLSRGPMGVGVLFTPDGDIRYQLVDGVWVAEGS